MYIPFGSCLLSYASDWGQLTRQINKISQSYKAPLCDHIQKVLIEFKADRLQMIVVAKKYICVATVHQ